MFQKNVHQINSSMDTMSFSHTDTRAYNILIIYGCASVYVCVQDIYIQAVLLYKFKFDTARYLPLHINQFACFCLLFWFKFIPCLPMRVFRTYKFWPESSCTLSHLL